MGIFIMSWSWTVQDISDLYENIKIHESTMEQADKPTISYKYNYVWGI